MKALEALVKRTRTFRRFDEQVRIRKSDLLALVNLARFTASGGNQQSLKYLLVCDRRRCALVFPCLAWAAYLKDWAGPAPGERPAAYILILGDTAIRRDVGCDHGLASQSIMLGATCLGLGGCIIGSVRRDRLRAALRIPARFEIPLVLALGRPRESVVLEPVRGGRIEYWRDARGRHHVPKRALRDLVVRPGN